jgi:hypothetical protein
VFIARLRLPCAAWRALELILPVAPASIIVVAVAHSRAVTFSAPSGSTRQQPRPSRGDAFQEATMRFHRASLMAGAAACALEIGALVNPSAAAAASDSRALTREGYRHAYDLRFEESLARLAEACRSDPSDVAPLRAIAAVTWMEILFTQGVATYAAFQGSPSGDTVARPAVPPHLAARFLANVEPALELAERHAAAAPADLDAQYQLGATLGLLALYRGTVEGRAFAAFMDGRRAVAIMKRIRDKDVNRHEAALVQGLYRYAVATLPWHKRLLATVAGLSGDREEGIRLLEAAAADSADTTLDASLVLMIVYNREGRHVDARRHLLRLLARHPDNRLLRLNLAATALDAGDHPAAARITTDYYPAPGEFVRLPVTGERALWSYIRGAARASLGDAGAEPDLLRATQEDPRDWIRARAHVELATLALRANDVTRAKTELEAARYFARRAGDDAAVLRAEQLWDASRQR